MRYKRLRLGTFVILGILMLSAQSGSAGGTSPAASDNKCTKAGQFCVNRETSSGVCHVQEATERPQFGINLLGPFKSRAEGRAAMCAAYSPASEDPAKCAEVAPIGSCDKATQKKK